MAVIACGQAVTGRSLRGMPAEGITAGPPPAGTEPATVTRVQNAASLEPAMDLLVLRKGDPIPGKLLAATPSAPLRWKSVGGKELQIAPERVAGIRFDSGNASAIAKGTMSIELRNSDRLRGEITMLDEKQMVIKHPQLGALAFSREHLLQIYPNRRFDRIEGGREAADPVKNAEASPEPDAREKKEKWFYFDGAYTQRKGTSGLNPQRGEGLHWTIPEGLHYFEVRCEASVGGNGIPSFLFKIGGVPSDPSFQATFGYPTVQLTQQIYLAGGKRQTFWKAFPLNTLTPAISSRINIRAFVDSRLGIVDFFVNGTFINRTGQQRHERLPGLGKKLLLGAYPNNTLPVVFSQVAILPWNGETPQAGQVPSTTFANDDIATGANSGFRDGKFLIPSEVGLLEVAPEKVKFIEFGGAMEPQEARGRIRLVDGSMLSVDQFQWDGSELAAHSAILGDLRLPADALAELIYQPKPLRPPPVLRKNETEKRGARVPGGAVLRKILQKE